MPYFVKIPLYLLCVPELSMRKGSGRKRQICVHLAEIGHPVVVDRKYGKGNEGNIRLALHAKSISFKHPSSGKRLTFGTGFPDYFYKLCRVGYT